jgi:xanthine dehydrogenase accessory factor
MDRPGRFLERVNELLDKAGAFCLVTVVRSDRPGAVACGNKVIVRSDGSLEQDSASFPAPVGLPELALKALAERKSRQVALEEGITVFIEVLAPEPRLVVCGAGHIAVPLALFARQVGFRVTVLDDRPELAHPARFPDCQVIAEDFPAALQALTLGPSTYVVVITRGHEHDRECLLEVLGKQTAYVGLIGSHRRIGMVKALLAREGISTERLEEIFTPIGLPIGAESPAELALCITAELVCVRNLGAKQTRQQRSGAGGGS